MSKTLVIVGVIAAAGVGIVLALRRRPGLCADVATGVGLPSDNSTVQSACGKIEEFVQDVIDKAPALASDTLSSAKNLVPGVGGGRSVTCTGYGELSEVELAELDRRRAGSNFWNDPKNTSDVIRQFCNELRSGWRPPA